MKLTFTGWHLGAWALPVVASALLAPSLLAQPSLSISGTNVAEGDVGSVQAVVTVTLTPASSGLVTVNYESSPATPAATGGAACGPAGIDFVNPSGTVEFAPRETSQTISVAVCGDTTQEPDEKFRAVLSNPIGAILGDAVGQGTITDDDGFRALAITQRVFGDEPSTGEQALAVFSVGLSGPPTTATVSVQFATASGTAKQGRVCATADYLARAGTLTFSPGTTTQQIQVPICGDSLREGFETFTVTLSNPVNAGVTVATGTATIRE